MYVLYCIVSWYTLRRFIVLSHKPVYHEKTDLWCEFVVGQRHALNLSTVFDTGNGQSDSENKVAQCARRTAHAGHCMSVFRQLHSGTPRYGPFRSAIEYQHIALKRTEEETLNMSSRRRNKHKQTHTHTHTDCVTVVVRGRVTRQRSKFQFIRGSTQSHRGPEPSELEPTKITRPKEAEKPPEWHAGA